MIKHEEYIKRTYQLAKSAQEKGNHPFGALLVIDCRIVFTAENSVITDNDITRHAELNLVSKVTRELDPEPLSQSILYTSTEPCAMCTGAIFWAGISNIVYGCSSVVLGEIAG
jgi:tRNA(Arg) A34 adenosine deaminase TadA